MPDAITIYTDGSCTGNPGPGGFAALIINPSGTENIITGGDPKSTNNRMELSAVIEALRAVAAEPALANTDIDVHTDSQYVCRAFQENWFRNWNRNGWRNSKGDPVQNQELWQDLLHLTENMKVSWHWVKGHSGQPENERCDRLANQMARAAPHHTAYWLSNPLETESPVPSEVPKAAVPEQPERDPGAEALRILKDISALLVQCPDYDQFRRKATTLMATARW